MKCLVCGHKLARFRKLSLGDFCCQEHRALYVKEQNERGLARLTEQVSAPKPRDLAREPVIPKPSNAGIRVYAEFLQDKPVASANEGNSRGHGPLGPSQPVATETAAPLPATGQFSMGLAPARTATYQEPQPGAVAPIFFEAAGISPRLPGRLHKEASSRPGTRLQQAGLILPWSSGAGSQTAFSLSPLVAAVWSQSGYSTPIPSHSNPQGALGFVWPGMAGRPELYAPTAAAFAPLEAPKLKPMRVSLATPSTGSHAMAAPEPVLSLPIPEPPAWVREYRQKAIEPAPAPPPAAPKKIALFAARPARVRAPRVKVQRERPTASVYDESAPIKSPSSNDAWRAMFSGLGSSMASAMLAILFLFSAGAIFLSAPAALSERSPSWRWGNLRNAIRGRAAMRFEDDFRAGLSHWSGPSGWSHDWSYDQAGFLRPGHLGFLQQSMNLKNYRLELMGQIERKSLGWTFRSKDENNYYVAKLTIMKPGPLPLVDLVHYPVVGGKEGAKKRVTLPFSVRNDTLYQVEMNVTGDQYRASVNGHVVDSWTDGRLVAGGVGFISGQDEASRVRWIRVSDRDDLLGKICSYLSARYEPPAGEHVLSSANFAIFMRPGL